MDELIANADFIHTDKDDYQHEFVTEVTRWIRQNGDNVSKDEVQRWLQAWRQKVIRKDFPPEGSSGYLMGYHLIQDLKGLISDMIREGRAQPGDFQQTYFELVMEMIRTGPLTSHIKYLLILKEDSHVEFNDYLHSLTGDALRRYVRTFMREYKADPGMEWQQYSVLFDSFVRIFIADSLSKEQMKEAHYNFVELYMYFNMGFMDKDLEMRKAMHNVAYKIELKYDRNVFKGFQHVSLLKKVLKFLGEVILAPEFPKAKDISDEAKDDLVCLLRAVSEGSLLMEMYESIMDLALAMTVQKAGQVEACGPHFEAIGHFFFHLNEAGVKDNGDLYEGLVKKFIHFLDNVQDDKYLNIPFVERVTDRCLSKAMGTSDEQVRLWIEMIKAILRHSTPKCVYAAKDALRGKEKVLKWKKYPEDIKEIFALVSKITYPKWLTEEQLKKGMDDLKKLTEYLLDEAKKVGVAKLELTGPMMDVMFRYIEMRTKMAYDMAEAVVRRIEFNPKKDKALMMEALRLTTAVVEDDSYNWGSEDSFHDVLTLSCTLQDLMEKALDCVKDGKYFNWEEYDDMLSLSKLCQEGTQTMADSDLDPDNRVYFRIYIAVSIKVAKWLMTMNEAHRLLPLIPGMIKLMYIDNELVLNIATAQMSMITNSAGNLFAPYLDQLISFFLEKEQYFVLLAISNSYQFNPAPMEKHFDNIFEYFDSGDSSVRSHILQILMKVAKHQPYLFTEDKVGRLVGEAKESATEQILLLMMLVDIAKKNVRLVEPHIQDLMRPDHWQPTSAYSIIAILQLYALQSEEKADQIISYLMKRITASSSEHTEVLFSLNACRLIGFKHRPAIEKHRGPIEKFKESTSDNDYHVQCTAILDMLDGKSLDKIAEELREVQGDVAELDLRVIGTERDIGEMNQTVQRHADDLDRVKDDVSEQGQRLDQVEDNVADTVAKVNEIDNKTLSHAPHWSRDVSRLLNIEADNDWRLLSLRLGFSNDDIRAWATTADPCMAMLDEWFATHKTREATHAVLTSLQLLDREDAAAIVENAMKTAEGVVEDDDFEYAAPPDIFLSYQWGHQDEVRLLRQHLEMAGFTCWMDVGQMGGGDKLFEKIDAGVRGAKMVLSCVTAKYAKSPNCNREVNLAVSLGKPVIPLLMEKMSWPPPGSMGPIFSQYLFIRFFQRGGEETPEGDQRYWPVPKFQELLMQLALVGVKPDLTAVQPEYKDWWVPPVEAVTVDKNRAKKQSSTSAVAPTPQNRDTSPDVFISYQWGKQPQILKLFGRLTSFGYRCWLDVMQMGGGDSLFDKIDRGLRGCRVVLACVTEKYAKSANCRREVSLADALQRPIVPLLLESDLSWPPPGPMSPVLTGLVYVDCSAPTVQDAWEGPGMERLLAAIRPHVPDVQGKGENEKSLRNEEEEQREMMNARQEELDAAHRAAVEKANNRTAAEKKAAREAFKKQLAAEIQDKYNNDAEKNSETASLMSDLGHDNFHMTNNDMQGPIPFGRKVDKGSSCCVLQ